MSIRRNISMTYQVFLRPESSYASLLIPACPDRRKQAATGDRVSVRNSAETTPGTSTCQRIMSAPPQMLLQNSRTGVAAREFESKSRAPWLVLPEAGAATNRICANSPSTVFCNSSHQGADHSATCRASLSLTPDHVKTRMPNPSAQQLNSEHGRAFDRQIASTKTGGRHADCRNRTGFDFEVHARYAPATARRHPGSLGRSAQGGCRKPRADTGGS